MSLVFDFHDYKPYLIQAIEQMPKRGRGFRSRLANAVRCQTAFVSQVLNGSAHFTLEQALAINPLLGHDEDEGNYFLLLVQQGRAGSPALDKHFRKQAEKARAQRLIIRERFKSRAELTSEQQMTFFSEWYFVALQILTSIPEYQTPRELQTALGLPQATLNRAISFLLESGIIRDDQGKLKIGQNRIHLGSDSPLISKHHVNWRLQAMRSLERGPDHDLHYTSVVSVSAADVERIKVALIDTIDRYNKIVAASPEEECHCLSLDFFKVTDLGR